ncbi:ArsR family transcriptional regulator [Halomicroarcula sp. GCM10025709]|uniref:DUF7344 domain-containing protein n=1 Tax=Haloarcula TaxID=2237 RepID=UPI0024C2EDE2|nr:hypothetical protein [Halomicroarcula sp. YJ-61-S]
MPRNIDSASLNVMFDALRNPYRRRILVAISDHNPCEITEFARNQIASVSEDEADPERLEVQLLHSHLPKLAEKGYIDWNPEAETIRRGPNFHDIAPLLQLLDDHAEKLPADWP